MRENGVFALRADKTKPAPEVDETLRRLGNKAASIPFYAIFPSKSPSKPILLDGLFTSPKPIVQALREAGPTGERREIPPVARTTEHAQVSWSKKPHIARTAHEPSRQAATFRDALATCASHICAGQKSID